MELLTNDEIERLSAEDLTKRYNALAKIIGYRGQRKTFNHKTAVFRYKFAQNKYLELKGS